MVARGWGSTGEHRCLIWSAGPHSSQLGYLEQQYILRFYSNYVILRECTWELWVPWKAFPLRFLKNFSFCNLRLGQTWKNILLGTQSSFITRAFTPILQNSLTIFYLSTSHWPCFSFRAPQIFSSLKFLYCEAQH